ncbi:MAG: helix-turn-helix domain-containing protein [Rhodospirillaceae bacterium]|nr:helix-turn-helix domain-containing protein [Rhodospirillaceae bacterium]
MKSFESVWDAIEDSQDVAEAMKARAEVMRALQKTIRGWKLPQSEAAGRLGITQPRLNDLLRGKIDKFSLDALFDLLPHARLKASISVKNATKASANGKRMAAA